MTNRRTLELPGCEIMYFNPLNLIPEDSFLSFKSFYEECIESYLQNTVFTDYAKLGKSFNKKAALQLLKFYQECWVTEKNIQSKHNILIKMINIGVVLGTDYFPQTRELCKKALTIYRQPDIYYKLAALQYSSNPHDQGWQATLAEALLLNPDNLKIIKNIKKYLSNYDNNGWKLLKYLEKHYQFSFDFNKTESEVEIFNKSKKSYETTLLLFEEKKCEEALKAVNEIIILLTTGHLTLINIQYDILLLKVLVLRGKILEAGGAELQAAFLINLRETKHFYLELLQIYPQKHHDNLDAEARDFLQSCIQDQDHQALLVDVA